MSCCTANSNQAAKAQAEKDKANTAALAKANKQMLGKIRLLLLGAGESGKSTIFKQMKILYGKPTSEEERKQYTNIIYLNTIQAMKLVVKAAETFGLASSVENQAAMTLIAEVPDTARIDPTIGAAILSLWSDPIIQEAWDRRAEYQVIDSMKYFFENITRIMDPNYLATPKDFLYTRVRTSGVVTTNYEMQGSQIEMYDVGGQRNERRKWIHCFTGVTAVIFVAAISEYDQVLFEDEYCNRMTEALELFEEICNLRYFDKSSILLFLNKYDLFQEKIARKPIANVVAHEKVDGEIVEKLVWSDYTGGSDVVAARTYFKEKFLAKNKNSKRTIYHHITTATDTSNVKFVIEDCREIILEQNIYDSGF